MTPLGIGPRDVLALTRYAQRSDTVGRPLLVTGVLAEQLASALSAGGDRGVVTTSGDPARAAALVRVVAGAATPEDEAQLRAATRALVPVVVVQTGISSVRLPYVLATDVIEVPPGQRLPDRRDRGGARRRARGRGRGRSRRGSRCSALPWSAGARSRARSPPGRSRR